MLVRRVRWNAGIRRQFPAPLVGFRLMTCRGRSAKKDLPPVVVYYLYPLVEDAGAAGTGEEDGVVTGVTGVEVA